ncbi:MAG: DUF4394 domain-containing protein [Bosea sp. (in: a-proteobacteria)]
MTLNRNMLIRLGAAVFVAAAVTAPLAVQAGTLAALTGDATLTMIDTDAKKVTKSVNVTGLSAKLAGIDVRPADGMLYGLTVDGSIYTIDSASGKATLKSKMDNVLPATAMATVDFNPVADRMRVIGSDGSNLRVNVEDGKTTVDGKLKFAETDANKAATPKIVAGAYSNSFKGTKETALYDIDAAVGALFKQAPPNDGVLTTIGSLGAKPTAMAFDIEADGKGGNTGWLLADGTLHKLDIATGMVSMHGKIAGLNAPARDVAALSAN